MSELPAPLVPVEVDLQDFAFMPLDVQRLRDSDLASEESPEACWAAVLLWCASWHQIPAGSIPDSNAWQAKHAGYVARGRIDKAWEEIKPGALRNWVHCSDGRLYHPVVAEKALTAWNEKLAQRARTRAATDAREAKRRAEQSARDDQRNVQRDEGRNVNATSTKGQGQGQGQGLEEKAEAIASGGKPPPEPPPGPIDPAEAIFALGLPLLIAASIPDKNARSFLGFLRKRAKGKGGDKAVVDAISRCAAERALQPVEFLQGCFKADDPKDDAIARANTTAEGARLLGLDTQETIDG